MTIKRYKTNPRLSNAVVHGGIAYFCGHVADDKSGDIAAQTREALGKLETRMAEVGSDKSRLLTATIFIRDMADKKAMDEVWAAWVPEGTAPARATLQATMEHPDYLIEIQAIAAL